MEREPNAKPARISWSDTLLNFPFKLFKAKDHVATTDDEKSNTALLAFFSQWNKSIKRNSELVTDQIKNPIYPYNLVFTIFLGAVSLCTQAIEMLVMVPWALGRYGLWLAQTLITDILLNHILASSEEPFNLSEMAKGTEPMSGTITPRQKFADTYRLWKKAIQNAWKTFRVPRSMFAVFLFVFSLIWFLINCLLATAALVTQAVISFAQITLNLMMSLTIMLSKTIHHMSASLLKCLFAGQNGKYHQASAVSVALLTLVLGYAMMGPAAILPLLIATGSAWLLSHMAQRIPFLFPHEDPVWISAFNITLLSLAGVVLILILCGQWPAVLALPQVLQITGIASLLPIDLSATLLAAGFGIVIGTVFSLLAPGGVRLGSVCCSNASAVDEDTNPPRLAPSGGVAKLPKPEQTDTSNPTANDGALPNNAPGADSATDSASPLPQG